MEFSTILERIKLGGDATTDEIKHVLEYLKHSDPDEDVYAAARVFAHSVPPTEENVSLLSKFLAIDADERSIKGAIMGMDYGWGMQVPQIDKIVAFAKPEMALTHMESLFFAVSALGTAARVKRHRETAIAALLSLLEKSKSLSIDDAVDAREYRLAVLEALEATFEPQNPQIRLPDECDLDRLEDEIRRKFRKMNSPK